MKFSKLIPSSSAWSISLITVFSSCSSISDIYSPSAELIPSALITPSPSLSKSWKARFRWWLVRIFSERFTDAIVNWLKLIVLPHLNKESTNYPLKVLSLVEKFVFQLSSIPSADKIPSHFKFKALNTLHMFAFSFFGINWWIMNSMTNIRSLQVIGRNFYIANKAR